MWGKGNDADKEREMVGMHRGCRLLIEQPVSLCPPLPLATQDVDLVVVDVIQNGGGYVCLGLRLLELLVEDYYDDHTKVKLQLHGHNELCSKKQNFVPKSHVSNSNLVYVRKCFLVLRAAPCCLPLRWLSLRCFAFS